LSRKTSFIIAFVVVLTIGLLFFYNNNLTQPKSAIADRTVTVKKGRVVAKLAETGSLEPLVVVEIKSEQSGEVRRLFVGEGDRVAAGQPLVIIQQELSQARQAAQFRADLEEERLNKEEAKRELDRQRELHLKGFASLREVEEAEIKYKRAKVKFDLAKRQLLLVLGGSREILNQYLERDLDSDELDLFQIRAPASGIVIELGVQEGEKITSGTATVGGGTALMRIANLSRMLVISSINEINITSVKLEQQVEIQIDAIPDHLYHGEVVAIAPKGERVDNVVTYQVTIEMKDSDDRAKPSMTANVDIITGAYEDVLYIPIEVLDREKGRDVVYVKKNGIRQAQPVKILAKTENVAVISDGLKENDKVLIPTEGPEEAS